MSESMSGPGHEPVLMYPEVAGYIERNHARTGIPADTSSAFADFLEWADSTGLTGDRSDPLPLRQIWEDHLRYMKEIGALADSTLATEGAEIPLTTDAQVERARELQTRMQAEYDRRRRSGIAAGRRRCDGSTGCPSADIFVIEAGA